MGTSARCTFSQHQAMQKTHGIFMSKKLGGLGDMATYEEAFGSFKFPTPSNEIFKRRDAPPTLDHLESQYGNSIHFGLRALFDSSKRSGRGKGMAFKHLASQPPAALVDAAVFIAQDLFSEEAQQQPLGVGDRFGYWYPCTIAWLAGGCLVAFWCPKLAIQGTKCWWVHVSRVVIFVPGLPDALPLQAERGDRCLVDKTNGKGKDSGDGVPDDDDDDDDDAASTRPSSEAVDSEISFSSASDGSGDALSAASSDSSWVALSSASSSLASWTPCDVESTPPLPAIDELSDGLDWQVVIPEEFDC
jgi:hypothetical protein